MGADGRRRVYVFTHPGKRGPRYMAYLLWVNPAWPGCCTHLVNVWPGEDAKKAAIREHKANCVKDRAGKGEK